MASSITPSFSMAAWEWRGTDRGIREGHNPKYQSRSKPPQALQLRMSPATLQPCLRHQRLQMRSTFESQKSLRHATPLKQGHPSSGLGGLQGPYLHSQRVRGVDGSCAARAGVYDQVAVVVGKHGNGQDFHPWGHTQTHIKARPPCGKDWVGRPNCPCLKSNFQLNMLWAMWQWKPLPAPQCQCWGTRWGRAGCLSRTHRGSSMAGTRSGRVGTAPGPSSPAADRRGSPAVCGCTGCTWGGQTPPALTYSTLKGLIQ